MKKVALQITIAAMVFAALPNLSAAPITFAQFTQTTAVNAWIWSNPAGLANSTFTATTNVTFEYLSVPGLPVDLQGPQQAVVTLTLSGLVTESAHSNIVQPGLNGQLSFRRLAPYLGEDDLLTATFTGARTPG